MSTLDELITKYSKVPGDIKVRCKVWPVDSYFIPYFVDAALEHCYGLNHDGKLDAFYIIYSDGWELYTEPKKKVKLYQYAYRCSYDSKWVVCYSYFKDDQEFTDYSAGVKVSMTPFLRLDYTMIEVNGE